MLWFTKYNLKNSEKITTHVWNIGEVGRVSVNRTEVQFRAEEML